MGVVFAARQETPVQRRVAVKLIRPGLDSREVLQRFDLERQALAMMDHRNIATFFDAGTTPQGDPYFVMELVDGEPITEYCDRRRLPLRRRIELFLPVCDAVQHAHQKGLLHRDLKPSNVLVAERDGEPLAKVIDFGIAKALGGSSATRSTRHGGLVGTPPYMSPEQLRGSADIDTRSDVYALGALLYRLLVGVLPHEIDEETPAQRLAEILQGTTPPAASHRASALGERLAAVATGRGVAPAALPRQLRGDLDWVLAKALDADRERRYSAVSELAADLRRYLAGQPVTAGPPSRTYRLRKLVRRHRLALAGAALVLASLIGGLVASQLALREARRARRVAEEQTAVAEAVSHFLETDLLGAAKPQREGDRELTLHEVLDRAAASLEKGFDGPPVVEAAVRRSLAEAYWGLGSYDDSLRHRARALSLRRSAQGPEHPETLREMVELGVSECRLGHLDAAQRLLDQGLPAALRVLGPDDRETLRFRTLEGRIAQGRGDLERSETVFAEVLAATRRVAADDDLEIARAANDLSVVQGRLGRPGRVEAQRIVYEAYRRHYGDDYADTVTALANLAFTIAVQGRLAEAEPLLREVLERRGRILGKTHPRTLQDATALSGLLRRRGRLDESRALAEEAYRGIVAALGDEAFETLQIRTNLARVLRAQGELEPAAAHMRAVVATARRTLGDRHDYTGRFLLDLGELESDLGRLDEARQTLLEAHHLLSAAVGETHPFTREAREALATLFERSGNAAEAERWRSAPAASEGTASTPPAGS